MPRLWPHALAVTGIALLVVALLGRNAPDTARYLTEARHLVETGTFSLDGVHPTGRDAPGLPFLLALFLLVGLPPAGSALVANAFATGATAWAIGWAVGRISGPDAPRRLPVVAVYATGLFPTVLGSAVFVLTESVHTALLTGGMVLLLDGLLQGRGGPIRHWLGGGTLLALAALVRPAALVVPFLAAPVLLAALVRGRDDKAGTVEAGETPTPARRWGSAGIRVGCMLGAAVLVLLPWTLRNWAAFGTPTPGSLHSGAVLYVGAHAGWDAEYPDRDVYEAVLGPDPGPLHEADAELRRRALKRIRSDPVAWLALAPKKLFRFWLGVPGAKRQIERTWLREGIRAATVLLLLLAATGVWRHRREAWAWWLLLLPVALAAVHTVLFAMARFRIPADPCLILLAATVFVPARPAAAEAADPE